MTSTTSVRDKSWLWVFLAWLVALTATLGALFLGEVMGVLPCVLCWYQRIAMFPLVIILAVGLMPFDDRCVDLVPCGEGASCTDVKAVLFGFVPVPLLSIAAFSLVVVILSIVKKGSRNE